VRRPVAWSHLAERRVPWGREWGMADSNLETYAADGWPA
jgi:hypothetical protein